MSEPTITSKPAAPAPLEPPARPKVLRRPAQFSRMAAPIARTTPEKTPKATASTPEQTRPAASWQEDNRFGLVLIGLLVVANLALIFATPLLVHDGTGTPASSVTIVSGTAMPSAMTTERQRITMYSDPEMLQENERRMDLNQLPPEHNDFSVSPYEVPPPEARAFGEQ